MILKDKQIDFLISCRCGYVHQCVLPSRGKEPYHLSFTPSSVVETPCIFPVCHLSCCLCYVHLFTYSCQIYLPLFPVFLIFFLFLPNLLSSNESLHVTRISLLRMTRVLNFSSDSFKLSAKHKGTRRKKKV